VRLADDICLITGAGAGIGRAGALAGVFLASDKSRFVMGSGLIIYGGLTGCRW